jgi:hypothetical protein
MRHEDHRRWVRINLPHARTVLRRIGRCLHVLGAFGPGGNGHAAPLHEAFDAVEAQLRTFETDPPADEALPAADRVAEGARLLVETILASAARNDRLGQHVRNLFECLGLPDEGAELALLCGEHADSPLR